MGPFMIGTLMPGILQRMIVIHSENWISESFRIEMNMILLAVFLLIKNKMDVRFVHNRV